MNLPLRTAQVTLLTTLMFAALPAAAQVLYNPATGPVNPALTGWLDGSLIGASASYSSNGAQVTPSAGNAAIAGWSNYPALLAINGALPPVNTTFPVLDEAAGYTLSFNMVLASEDHSGNANRAGFSVTLIGSDRKGVEIGFQNTRIFAQNLVGDSFFAGESSSDPALVADAFAPNHRWDLQVQGGSYQLTVDGLPVLAGALHDYSNYTGNGANAYRTPNFLFLGDNTTSAGASFLLSYAAISAVPEPASWALLALGGIALALRRKRFS